MPKRSSKPKQDVNQLAVDILRAATGDLTITPQGNKNPAAVALGRLGGIKGGKARAKALTPAKRSKIAKKAECRSYGASASYLFPIVLVLVITFDRRTVPKPLFLQRSTTPRGIISS